MAEPCAVHDVPEVWVASDVPFVEVVDGAFESVIFVLEELFFWWLAVCGAPEVTGVLCCKCDVGAFGTDFGDEEFGELVVHFLIRLAAPVSLAQAFEESYWIGYFFHVEWPWLNILFRAVKESPRI